MSAPTAIDYEAKYRRQTAAIEVARLLVALDGEANVALCRIADYPTSERVRVLGRVQQRIEARLEQLHQILTEPNEGTSA